MALMRFGNTWLDPDLLVYLHEVPGHHDRTLHHIYRKRWTGALRGGWIDGNIYFQLSARDGDALHAYLESKHQSNL